MSPTLNIAKRLTRCKEGASFYMANGQVVAIVFPGESHSDAWVATDRAFDAQRAAAKAAAKGC